MEQYGPHALNPSPKASPTSPPTEPAFVAAIDRHGHPEPRNSERGTAALLRTIVGQQVSVAAARSMWNKLTGAYGDPPDLTRLAAATDEELRALGQSRQKGRLPPQPRHPHPLGRTRPRPTCPRTMRKPSRS